MKIDLREIPIIYMNMNDDVIRDRDMKTLFEDLSNYGFKKENVYRVPGLSRNPVRPSGISEAHLNAIKFAKRFDGPVLILEDDLELSNLETILDVPDDSDAVYLGNMKFGATFAGAYSSAPKMTDNGITVQVIPDVYSNNTNIYRVISMTGGHAILYITQTYKTILENSCKLSIESGIAHDTYLATVQRLANVYAYNMPFFINKTCRWDSTFLLEQALYNSGRPFKE